MTTALVSVEQTPSNRSLAHLEDLRERAQGFAEASSAKSTRRAYHGDYRHFREWCGAHGVVVLPALPASVALYLSELARTYKVATIARRIAAISQEHRKAGLRTPFTHPRVVEVWEGIRRTLGVTQARKDAILTADLRRMLEPLTDTTIDIRDRALLLLGFAGAFRRSELVALDVVDVRIVTNGLEVILRRSKTDQEREGRLIGIPYGSNLVTCPVRSVQGWLDRSAIVDGPLFRAVDRGGNIASTPLSDQTVALIVKRRAQRAGFDPTRFGGHSLRAGFATSAALAGADALEISRQTGHRSLSMVARYTRPATIWQMNAAHRVGL
ncbi:MAG TPA: site-specific integrase [Candidatus Binatia bacterium]|nr:site-specific integrase [Candidatus Binatia bacterium]